MGRGGEVFLTDPDFHYIGRTCPWKLCGPGIRVSCEARHCGAREYLYDDLDVVRLDTEVTSTPPIELWPQIKARVDVPADVQTLALEPLRAE